MNAYTRSAHYLVIILSLSTIVDAAPILSGKMKLLLTKIKAALPKLLAKLPQPVKDVIFGMGKAVAWVLAFVGLEKGAKAVYDWVLGTEEEKDGEKGIVVALPGGEKISMTGEQAKVSIGRVSARWTKGMNTTCDYRQC
jgi:hypothetical protein